MTALDRIGIEKEKIVSISRRRALWDDEQERLKTLLECEAWIKEDEDRKRLEDEIAEEERRLNDPVVVAAQKHAETRGVFDSYRKKLSHERGAR